MTKDQIEQFNSCVEEMERLNEWEYVFIESIENNIIKFENIDDEYKLTDKQSQKLEQIYDKLD